MLISPKEEIPMKKLKIGGIANQKHFPAMKQNSDLCEIVAF